MNYWQILIIIFYMAYSTLAFLKGTIESYKGKNTHGSAANFFFTGSIVWADAVIFGAFWTLASLLTIYLNDWVLFLLFQSVFWTVRAWGESVYWFNQQFSEKINVQPENMRRTYEFFKNDSVWFVRQVQWQCVMVIGIISTIYLAKVWF